MQIVLLRQDTEGELTKMENLFTQREKKGYLIKTTDHGAQRSLSRQLEEIQDSIRHLEEDLRKLRKI